MPSPGKIQYLRVPGGPNVRDDSGVFAGYTVPNFYDPMISKLSVWAPTRAEAIARAQRALSEYVVKGITTNTRYLKAILAHPEFAGGDYDTSFLSREHTTLLGQDEPTLHEVALRASAVFAHQRDQKRAKPLPQRAGAAAGASGMSAWRQGLRTRRR
jgi:acetyl-CoA carboxylase biotin carboxylase subunit